MHASLGGPSLTEMIGKIIALPDSVKYTYSNSLTPSAACPNYAKGSNSTIVNNFRASYRSGQVERLNRYLNGLVLDQNDVGIMGDLCGFLGALNGDTRFCDVFTGKKRFLPDSTGLNELR